MNQALPPWGHFLGVALFRWRRRDVLWMLLALIFVGLGAWAGVAKFDVSLFRATLSAGVIEMGVGLYCMGARFRDDMAFRSTLLLIGLGLAWFGLVALFFHLTGRVMS